MSADEWLAIEQQVNEQILRNHTLKTAVMPIEQAKAAGAMALFGEKYDDDVRVVTMGDYSMELCGGTHVERTGDIGLFRLVAESGIASGVRRIEAVTGHAALQYMQAQAKQLKVASSLLKTDQNKLVERIEQVLDKQKVLERELGDLQKAAAAQAGWRS